MYTRRLAITKDKTLFEFLVFENMSVNTDVNIDPRQFTNNTNHN